MTWTQTFLSLAQIVQLYGVLLLVVSVAVWVAIVCFVLFWRWLVHRDARAALAEQADALQEITRLKALLWDSERARRQLAARNRHLETLVEEQRNHNRNWNARTGAAVRSGG